MYLSHNAHLQLELSYDTSVFYLKLLTSVFYCPVPGPTGNASAEGWTGRGLHQELSC